MNDCFTQEKLTDRELLKEALNHLSEACCFLYESESDKNIALAFMVDSAIRYGSAIYQYRDPLISEEFYYEHLKEKEMAAREVKKADLKKMKKEIMKEDKKEDKKMMNKKKKEKKK